LLRPAGQPQAPSTQISAAAHTLLQAPQFRSSEARSTQAPEHAINPPEQVLVHVPCEQTLSAAQAVPHAPQWALLFSGSTQAPAQVI
jgi:hypothetical protein